MDRFDPASPVAACTSAGPPTRFVLSVHGAAATVDCAVPGLCGPAEHLLGPFRAPALPATPVPVSGSVLPYDVADVARSVRASARRVRDIVPAAAECGQWLEVYEDGERFWLVDDRWGMAEINLLRVTWRSWVLPAPRIDPHACAELAVLWPLAQLLRGRGVHLVPAASVARDGWGALILCPFPIEPELTALARAGWQIVGQRWTAVRDDRDDREENDGLTLLHLPGWVERDLDRPARFPRLPFGRRRDAADGGPAVSAFVDLAAEHSAAVEQQAACGAVLVMEPRRQPAGAHLQDVRAGEALTLLRRHWPIPELYPNRRQPHLPARLARHCRCAAVQLSREPRDLVALVRSLQLAAGGDVELMREVGDEPDSGLDSFLPQRPDWAAA